MRLQEWQERKQNGEDLTLDEICDLEEAVKRGDSEAAQILDDAASSDGYKDWKEYLEKEWKPFFEQWRNLTDQALGRACGLNGKISDDDAFKMFMARMQQPEIANDPVLGLWVESARKTPIVQAVKAIKAKMTKPISIQSATSKIVSPHPETVKRDHKIIAMRKNGRSIFEITQEVGASEATVKRVLRKSGLTKSKQKKR